MVNDFYQNSKQSNPQSHFNPIEAQIGTDPPTYIDPQHWQEWLDSGVDPKVISASVRSLSGEDPYEYLLYSEKLERTNTGRLSAKWLRTYGHIELGGWWCSGLDPLNDWQPMTWGTFKPGCPRVNFENHKQIKYENPPRTETRGFFLPASLEMGVGIAQKQGKEHDYVERIWDSVKEGRGQPATAEEKAEVYRALDGGQHRRACELLRRALHQSRDVLREPGRVHLGGTAGVKTVRNQPTLAENRCGTAESGSVAGGVYPSPGAVRAEGRIFWQWVTETVGVPLVIVEGVKKAGSLLAAGYAAIGLPGVFNGYRSKDEQGSPIEPHLISDLRDFAIPSREIRICFDHDLKPSTAKNVDLATFKLGKLLTKAGCQVRVIELPGPEKGVDDFIAAKGCHAFTELHDSALPLESWKAKQYSRLTYPATLTLNQKYLGELPIPSDAKLIGLKSPKGSGKTESLIPIVSEAINNGQWVLLIGHRVQLVRAICDRVGIDYVTDVRDSETGRLLGYGLCIDSLHPQGQALFSADGWHDGVVILDESEQVIWHLLNSHTEVKKRRVEVLRQLRQLLTQVLASDRGRVVLSDADLSDVSIDFVRGLAASSVDPWICLNTWKPEQAWTVHNYDQKNPIEWLAALETDIEGGGIPFVVSQGQKINSKWGTQTLEEYLSQRFPNKRVLRIDAETVADPEHPAYGCITRLNELLTQYSIVIASPTIESGISIDIREHFTGVWGCFQGVLPENSARQSLARVREPVARHIWAPAYGIGRIGNGETSLKSLLASEHKLAKAHIHLLQDASLVLEDEETLSINATALNIYGKMACRINAGMLAYRQSILDGLKVEGHCIVDVSAQSGEIKVLAQEITQARDRNYQANCKAIANSRELQKDEFEKLSQLRAKTSEERLQERKYRLRQRYQVPITPDLVTKDDDGWYSSLRLHYYLTVGKDHLKARDRRAVESIVQDGKAWLPDFNQSQLGAAIKTLEVLGVPKLIDPQREYRGTDEDLVQMAALAIAHRGGIKLTLGIMLKETDAPVLIAQKLLGKLGLKLTLARKEGKRGNQQRVYTFVPPQDAREEVFTAWLERDEPGSQNVSSSDTVVRGGNKEYIKPAPDYQTGSHALVEESSPSDNSSKLESQAGGYCQFAVGYRVSVVCSGIHQGQAGKVAELDPEDNTYRVELNTGGEGWWRSEHLQVEDIEQSSSQSDPKLDDDEWEDD